MPDNSNNNVCLIIYDSSFQLADKTYYINKLYIRPSKLNKSIYSDISQSQILANRIPYLKLDNSGGEILKASIYNNLMYRYTAGYDICGNLQINPINEPPTLTVDISNDINYLFPPNNSIQDNSYTHLAVENTFFDSSINLYSERSIYNSYSQKISASSYGYKSAITKQPLHSNADNSNNIYYVEDKNFFANNLLSTVYIPEESSFNFVYDYIQHDFNTTSWFTPLKKFDNNVGIFIGQFVFSEHAKGVMCHEFYQDISAKNWNDPHFTSSSNVPFTAFLDISGGQLYFTPDVYFNSSLDKKQFLDNLSGNEKSGIIDISGLYDSIYNHADADSADFSANYYNDGFKYYAKFLSLFYKTNSKSFIYNQQKNADNSTYDISSVAFSVDNKYKISYSYEVTAENLNQYTDFPFVYKDSRLASLNQHYKKILESTYKHANEYFSSYPPDISQSIVISSIDPDRDNSYNFLILDSSYSLSWIHREEESYNKNFINPIFNNTKTLIIGRDGYMNILNILSNGEKQSIDVSNNTYQFNEYRSLENLIINNNLNQFILINHDSEGATNNSNFKECKSLKKVYFPHDISFSTSDYNVVKGTTIKKIYINEITEVISNALLYNKTEISANVYFDNYFTNRTKEQFYFTTEGETTNVLSITTFPFSSLYNNITFVKNFTDISDIEQHLYKTKPFDIIINLPESYTLQSDNRTNIIMGPNILIFNSNQTYDMSYNFKHYQSDISNNSASSYTIT